MVGSDGMTTRSKGANGSKRNSKSTRTRSNNENRPQNPPVDGRRRPPPAPPPAPPPPPRRPMDPLVQNMPNSAPISSNPRLSMTQLPSSGRSLTPQPLFPRQNFGLAALPTRPSFQNSNLNRPTMANPYHNPRPSSYHPNHHHGAPHPALLGYTNQHVGVPQPTTTTFQAAPPATAITPNPGGGIHGGRTTLVAPGAGGQGSPYSIASPSPPPVDLQAPPPPPPIPVAPSENRGGRRVTLATTVANASSSRHQEIPEDDYDSDEEMPGLQSGCEDSDDEDSDDDEVLLPNRGRPTTTRRPNPQDPTSLPRRRVDDPPPPHATRRPVPVDPATGRSYTIGEVARHILNSDTLYGSAAVTATTRAVSAVTTRHSNRAQSLMNMIFALLQAHPSPELQSLAMMTEDPETGLQIRQFWLHLKGEPTEAKKHLLNAILCLFARSYRKKAYRDRDPEEMDEEEQANSEYQPNVLGTTFRTIFGDLRKNGVHLGQKDFNNYGDGCFSSLISERMDNAARHRPEYGRRPNRAHFDQNEDFLIRKAAEPAFDIYKCFHDLMLIFFWCLSKLFMLRGAQEPASLMMTDLELYTKEKGPFKGLDCLRIKGLRADKSHKLSLKNQELRGEGDGVNDIVEDPEDKFCVVRLYKEVLKRYGPNYTGRVFRRAATRNGEVLNRPNMNKNGVIGKNKFSTLTKEVAGRCNMVNPDKCTAAGRRRAGVSALANSSNAVPEAERMNAARHKCPTTHAKYQEPNEEHHAARYRAMHYDEDKFEHLVPSPDKKPPPAAEKKKKKKAPKAEEETDGEDLSSDDEKCRPQPRRRRHSEGQPLPPPQALPPPPPYHPYYQQGFAPPAAQFAQPGQYQWYPPPPQQHQQMPYGGYPPPAMMPYQYPQQPPQSFMPPPPPPPHAAAAAGGQGGGFQDDPDDTDTDDSEAERRLKRKRRAKKRRRRTT